jgi:hypothetical protein
MPEGAVCGAVCGVWAPALDANAVHNNTVKARIVEARRSGSKEGWANGKWRRGNRIPPRPKCTVPGVALACVLRACASGELAFELQNALA